MGKATGFLEYDRKNNPAIDPAERTKHFDEFHPMLLKEERQEQGARCMNCGVPFCQSAMALHGAVTGCPLHNLIPEWNDEIYHGNWGHALSRLLKNNSFPEFTGRVCPALCEAACTCGLYDDPVTVKENELFVIEYGFQKGLMEPQPPAVRTDKKVAVIGSGPSGLACADKLNKRGHNVTVFEKEDRPGGLLMYGIPNMKLEKWVVARRVDLMRAEGVRFVTGKDIRTARDAKALMKEFDAVVLCVGAGAPRDLMVEACRAEKGAASAEKASAAETAGKCSAGKCSSSGAEMQASGIEKTGTAETAGKGSAACAEKVSAAGCGVEGIYFAVDFLKSTTKSLLSDAPLAKGSFVSAAGKKVVVVGGGDTGNDCVGTAIRHGCKSVIQLEMMPKPPTERTADNQWPQWPKVLKVDYGQEEAIDLFGADPRVYQTTVKAVIADEAGKLKALRTVGLAPSVDEKTGRTVMTEVPGSEAEMEADLLLIAAGFLGPQPYVAKAFGVKTDGRSNIAAPVETSGSAAETGGSGTLGNGAASGGDSSSSGAAGTWQPGAYRTSTPAVFAAGDGRRGQSLVVWAITEGRACAKEVDRYLMNYTNMI